MPAISLWGIMNYSGGCMKKIVLLVLAGLFAVSCQAFAKASSGKIVVQVDLSHHGSKTAAQVWIPYPVSNASQTITQVKIQGSMSESGVYTDQVFSVPMLYAKWEKALKKEC